MGQQKADLSPITLNYPKLKVWPEIQSNWIDAFTVYKNCLSRGEKGKKSILANTAIDSPCSPWREKRHLEFKDRDPGIPTSLLFAEEAFPKEGSLHLK